MNETRWFQSVRGQIHTISPLAKRTKATNCVYFMGDKNWLLFHENVEGEEHDME